MMPTAKIITLITVVSEERLHAKLIYVGNRKNNRALCVHRALKKEEIRKSAGTVAGSWYIVKYRYALKLYINFVDAVPWDQKKIRYPPSFGYHSTKLLVATKGPDFRRINWSGKKSFSS
jgi:hypothetical protein